MYMHIGWQYIYGTIPLLSAFPFLIPFASLLFSFTYLETLLAVIGSRPPWFQVARKLISPFPSPPHSLPTPKSRPLGFSWAKCALTKTTSQNWLTSPEQLQYSVSAILKGKMSSYVECCRGRSRESFISVQGQDFKVLSHENFKYVLWFWKLN